MANEDYHEMEMSRRSIKINTIRQELEDASEREQEAQERLAQLDRQIQEKKVHIVVFKQNAQGMEDQAAASEAFCLQNHRLMKEDEEDVRSEAEALNEKLAKTARSLEKAQADAIQAQRAAEAQEEAKKRQAEETAKHAAQLATLEATMAAATADVESIQETIRELEVTLEMEKKTGKELQDSVNAEEEKRQETQLECDRLMHFLESLSSRGNKEELSKALAAMQREHSQLQQELITKKTNVLIKQQEIRGRLDETRRIHEERKVSAADVAAIALNASGPIAALTVTLEEERRKAEAARETRLQLEAEVKALEKQLAESPKVNLQSAQRPTEPAKCENDQSGQEELQAAQEKLDAAKRQLREKDEALQMGQQQLTQTRQEAQNTVEVLRAKLKELWSAIGQIKGF